MAVLSHYEDIVDLQVRFLTDLHNEFTINVPDEPMMSGSGLTGDAIASQVNEGFRQYNDSMKRMLDKQIETAQQRRPPFCPGEAVVVLSYHAATAGEEGLVVETDHAVNTASTYVVLINSPQELKVCRHENLRPRLLYRYSASSDYIIPEYDALELADPVSHVEVIHDFGKYIGLLRDAVKAADQIHKHTDRETEEQQGNAQKTRETIIKEITEPLKRCRDRMAEEGLVYVHGRFYRVV